jgi:hypothetical protein
MVFNVLAPGQSAHVRAQAAAVSVIPRSAPVAATNHLGAHLSARRHFYSFPLTAKAEWVAIDLKDPDIPTVTPDTRRTGLAVPVSDLARSPARFRHEVAKLRSDPEWKLVFSRDSILVWHRREANA